VVGGDTLRVAEELGDFGERTGPLVVQRAAAAPERVRREVRDTAGSAGARDCHAKVGVRDAGEQAGVRLPVLAWRERRQERRENLVGQVQVPVTLVLLGIGPDADRLTVLVDVADERRLELRDAGPALVL
jgi:hypothetical protein